MANNRYTYNASGQDVENVTGEGGVSSQIIRPKGYTASKLAEEQPVAPTPTPAPTGVKSRYTAPTEGTYETEQARYLADVTVPVNAEEIRRQKVDQAQAQIDAINKRFDVAVAAEEKAGVGYMGQTRAAASRGGVLGSDFGASQLSETERQNRANIDAVNAKRNLELTAVWDKIDQRAIDEVNRKSEAALKGRESYINFLKETRDEARTDFTSLAKLGQIKSLSELNDEDYQKLLTQTGYDEATAKLVFNANLPSQQKTDYQFKIEGNKLIAYGIDPMTNQVDVIEKQLEDNVPANYKPTVLPDGTLIFTPDKIDPSKDLKDQVIMYGAEGQFIKPKTTGGGSTGTGEKETPEEKAFAADLKKARADLAAKGGEVWGKNFDYLANQYGFSSDEDKQKLDQLLNKEMYTSK